MERRSEQRVTSNDLGQFARMQYLRYNLHPSAIHFVDDPAHVAKAAATGFQNFVHETSLGKILSRISGHTARYCHINHPVPMYVSEGPRIAAWQGSRTGLGARDRFLGGEPVQHWEARLAVESDQPIKEVCFSNGPHLMRRHLPSRNSFDHVYHGFHDRQHNLFAAIVDAAGRRAVTSCLITLTLRNMLVNNNWSAGIWGRDSRILSRVGGRDGIVWANIDISRDRDLFIGNLISCDQPDLVLIFLEGDQERSVFQAHNPTDEAIAATVRSHTRFDRIRPIRRDIRVPAGTTVEVVCE